MRIIEANELAVLNLGYAGEKDRTQVRFYFGDLDAEFPNGAVLLQVKRPCERDYYNVLLEINDGYAVWTVSEYDCAVRGMGECQLIYSTDSHICKRKIWRTTIDRSIEGSNISVPPDWESIEASLLLAAGVIQNAIENAGDIIDEARMYAEMAQQGAAIGGYMRMYINDDGDLIYVKSRNVNVSFALSEDGDLLLTGV